MATVSRAHLRKFVGMLRGLQNPVETQVEAGTWPLCDALCDALLNAFAQEDQVETV